MSKAKRLRNKQSQANKRAEMKQHVELARARQESLTGREDLPNDPLGVALGGNHITQAEYGVGREFERLMTSIYGQPHAKTANLNPAPANGDRTETAKDLREQQTLSMMRNELRRVNKLSVVIDMCWAHEWCQRRFEVLKLGLTALVNMDRGRAAA